MPNWADPDSIKKWLEQQDKTVQTTRRRPTEDRDERARATTPDRLPHWERPAQTAPQPRPESTYTAPPVEHSDAYHEAWRKPGERRPLDPAYSPSTTYHAPTAWDLPGQVDPRRTPYTNYQALPQFIVQGSQNPVVAFEGGPARPDWNKTADLWYRVRDADIALPPTPSWPPSPDYFPTTQYYDQSMQLQIPGSVTNIAGYGQLHLPPQYIAPAAPDYGYFGAQSHTSPVYLQGPYAG